jgi:formylglycine-generating enzyme required for sulfatase activity
MKFFPLPIHRLIALAFIAFLLHAERLAAEAQPQPVGLTPQGQKLQLKYETMLSELKADIAKSAPQLDAQKKTALTDACKAGKLDDAAKILTELALTPVLSSDKMDPQLLKFVILQSATPKGLATYAEQGAKQESLVSALFSYPDLMRQMLVADGANGNEYGKALDIYQSIRKASAKSMDGVLQRLALAVALEHAVPIKQDNPASMAANPVNVDPLKRYLSYEKAFLNGELDPAFKDLTTWDMRHVINGTEPDETHTWGREMLRNYRPDIASTPDYNWRYVRSVSTDVMYGSTFVMLDRPELQQYQNIIMNGGICGRRAWFGRFILRAFGIPTVARPQRGHAALLHWTPKGWVPCLGAGWGGGWTPTRYNGDQNFLATTQGRACGDVFLQVKRAEWWGDFAGEKPVYGLNNGAPGFWYAVSLLTQRDMIEKSKTKALDAVGTNLGESNDTGETHSAEKPVINAFSRKIVVIKDGVIIIPASAYTKPVGNSRDVWTIPSFGGGEQINFPRFGREGYTILRGGGWRGDANGCKAGSRLLSGGWGTYNNWGFRAAMNASGDKPQAELKLDLGGGVSMEFVYIKPGSFVMGGENEKEGRFECVEIPKHEVILTKGFYIGKYEVTQAQYQAITGQNSSGATKDPNCPVDNTNEAQIMDFCMKLSAKAGSAVRLPTEAEWEYACRAGSQTTWFFGDDVSKLGEYAWFKDNDGGKSHPVGQKKPNAWGLYDMCGNVYERVSDTYARDYYAKSPKEDPTGPTQRKHSAFEYIIQVPHSGTYELSARVVTNNYDQKLKVSANGNTESLALDLPFTLGQWKDSKPVMVNLKQGDNTLQFFRDDPPQAGVAVKSFTLKLAK